MLKPLQVDAERKEQQLEGKEDDKIFKNALEYNYSQR